MSLFEQQWQEGRVPLQWLVPTTSTPGGGEGGTAPATGDYLPDGDNTRALGNGSLRWASLDVVNLRAASAVVSGALTAATAAITGVLNASGIASLREIQIGQSDVTGSLLTAAGTGTMRVRTTLNSDAGALTMAPGAIKLKDSGGGDSVVFTTATGGLSVSGPLTVSNMTASSVVTGGTVVGNYSMAAPVAYTNSIYPITSGPGSTLGAAGDRWGKVWASAVDTTTLTLGGAITAASATLTGAINALQIVPTTYSGSQLGNASFPWENSKIIHMSGTDLSVTGAITGNTSSLTGNFYAAGNVQAGGQMIAGSGTVVGALSVGSSTSSGSLAVSGGAVANTVQANTSFSTPVSYINKILPLVYSSSTLGESTNYWREVWVTNLYAAGAALSGAASIGGLLTAGAVTSTGTVTAPSVVCGTVGASGAITSAGGITASGTVTGGTVVSGGNVTASNTVLTTNVAASGSVTAGSASVSGTLSAGATTVTTLSAGSASTNHLDVNGELWNGQAWETNAGLWVNGSGGIPAPYLRVNYTDLFGTTTLRNPANTAGIEVGSGGSGMIRMSTPGGGVNVVGGGLKYDSVGFPVKHYVMTTTNATNTDTWLDTAWVVPFPTPAVPFIPIFMKLVQTEVPNSATLLGCHVQCRKQADTLTLSHNTTSSLRPWIAPCTWTTLSLNTSNGNPETTGTNWYYEATPQQSGTSGNWEIMLVVADWKGISDGVRGQPVTIDLMYY